MDGSVDPADHVRFAGALSRTLGAKFGHLEHEEILSCCYEAMVFACARYNGKIPIRRWIVYVTKKYLLDLARDRDLLRRRHREDVNAGKAIFENPVFVTVEEANLSCNGEEIDRMMDAAEVASLIKGAHLSDMILSRLNRYYYGRCTHSEIAKKDGVGQAAVSLSLIWARDRMRRCSESRSSPRRHAA
jgi:hypothetical protein